MKTHVLIPLLAVMMSATTGSAENAATPATGRAEAATTGRAEAATTGRAEAATTGRGENAATAGTGHADAATSGHAQAAAASAAETAAPSAEALASAARAALHPEGSSSRDLTIEVQGKDAEKVTWQGRQHRKTVDGARRIVTVLTHPPSVAGFAILMKETSPNTGTTWMYVPPVRRVRHLIHEGRYENFLGTDFSASSFGILRLDADARVTGKVAKDGVDAWQIEEILDPRTGYSKILTWVAIASHLPIRREYYDTSGKLWKVETIEDVATEGGVSLPRRIVMTDLHEGSRSVLQYRGIRSDVELDDGLFEPAGLARAGEGT